MKLDATTLACALREAGGNVRDAALALGVSRQAVYDAVARFGIERDEPAEVISAKRRAAARSRWDRRSA